MVLGDAIHRVGSHRIGFILQWVGLGFMARWLVGGLPFYALVLATALLDVRRTRAFRDRSAASGIVLSYYVFFVVGVGGVWNAVGHSALADQVSRSIGWQAGSPFQLELAAAHLAWAAIALPALWLHEDVVRTIVVSKAIFLFGAFSVHVVDLVSRGNRAPGNAGFSVLIFGDVLVPLATVLLLGVWTRPTTPGVVERWHSARGLRMKSEDPQTEQGGA